ncbi:tetratricopeptide repeat protein [Desulfurispira natronophila]|nr:tetratricopeptide repeat protein [Desulfurispira natronophila]
MKAKLSCYMKLSLIKASTLIFIAFFILLMPSPVQANNFFLGKQAASNGEYTTAYKLWLPLAKEGHTAAQHNIGQLYHYELGVQDQQKRWAIHWLTKAACQGNHSAQHQLGYIYYTKGQYETAAKWYEKAAHNVPEAAYSLGYLYQKGMGGEASPQKSYKWYQIAAAQDHTYAQMAIRLLPNHNTQFADYRDTLHWHNLATQSSNPIAQHNLGVAYRTGHGVYKNYSDALHWFRYAAAHQYSHARTNLGFMYLKGFDHQLPDYDEARFHFYAAAQEEHEVAQYALGIIYLEGIGVDENIELGLEWLHAAALQNYSLAHYTLGKYYTNKHKETQQHDIAFQWFQRAADTGMPRAHFQIGLMQLTGKGTDINVTQAFKSLLRAAAKSYAPASFKLGYMSEQGVGVSVDLPSAYRWYQKAEAQGHEDARLAATRVANAMGTRDSEPLLPTYHHIAKSAP